MNSGSTIKRIIRLSAFTCGAAVFILITLLMMVTFASSVLPLLTYGSQNFNEHIYIKAIRIALFTLTQALFSTVLALMAGIPLAFWTAKRSFCLKKILLSLSSVPLCIPSLIIALGYVSFFGMNGSFNRFIMYITGSSKPPFTFLYTMAGIVICQGFYNFPLIMGTVSAYWENLSEEEADCARILGASEIHIFRTITWYKLLPSVISAAIPVFIFCFFSFMIILLFGSIGCTTLEVEIYQYSKSLLDYKTAAFYALIETVISFLMITVYTVLEIKAQKNKEQRTSDKKKHQKKISGFTESMLFFLTMLFITIFFFLPLSGIVLNAFTHKKVSHIFTLYSFVKIFNMKSFIGAVQGTLTTGCAVSVICIITAFTYSCFLRTRDCRKSNLILKTIPVIPMTVSNVVLALGFIILVHQGTVLHLVLAQSIITWPVAFRQIYPYMAALEQDMIDSAVMLSKSVTDTVFNIFIPCSWKGILRALGFCFAISAGDTTLPLVLSVSRFDTLSLFTYRLAGSYRFNEACASGLILGFICSVVFYAADKIKRRD